MNQLIYHPFSSISLESPFDNAVIQVAKTGAVRIVSPYIGVTYLERIISVAGDWQLISDVEAWLTSLSFRARAKAWQFIRENLNQIHHCPAIHAKAVISETLAMFGSANLTNTGILGRTEMGILIADPLMVKELVVWFDALWEQTSSPIIDEANTFVQWLDDDAIKRPLYRQKISLTSSVRKVRAKLSNIQETFDSKNTVSPLKLEIVAKSLVQNEELYFDTLEKTLDASFDKLATNGFAFRHVVESVKQSFPKSLIREIYFGTINRTANHIRSVFNENTQNRLILRDAEFFQSTREELTNALIPFDNFLKFLIEQLSFTEFVKMPDENTVELRTGFKGVDQVILTSALLENGFLILEDMPGKLPLYLLDPEFDWNNRFKLFENSYKKWRELKFHFSQMNKQGSHKYFRSSVTFTDSITPSDTNDYIANNRPQPKITSFKKIIEKKEMDQTGKVDRVLSRILFHLFNGATLQFYGIKGLISQLAEETFVGTELVRTILISEMIDVTKIINIKPSENHKTSKKPWKSITINPSLSWADLENFPASKKICEQYLSAPIVK